MGILFGGRRYGAIFCLNFGSCDRHGSRPAELV
eukprot:COSAG04_NODE_20968_length_382_cov_0.915194_2_plen_32_part_01